MVPVRPLLRLAVAALLLAALPARTQPLLLPGEMPVLRFSTIRWEGSQRLWYSTFVPKADITDTDRTNLRVPEDSFPNHAWVNRRVLVHGRIRSETLEVRTAGPLEFFAEPPTTTLQRLRDGGTVFQTAQTPVVRVDLAPSEGVWLLLMVQSDPLDPASLRIHPLLDQVGLYPAGSVQFWNISEHESLHVILDRQVRKIDRGGVVGFTPGADTGTQIQLHFADPSVNPDKPVYSNMWYHEADRRFILIVSERSRERAGLDIKVIRE